MKWKWIVPTIIVVVAIGGFVIHSFIPRVAMHTQKPPEPAPFDPFDIEFELMGESNYDPTYFYETLGYVKDSDCTEYESILGEETDYLNEMSTQMNFQTPDGLDQTKYSYIITYGRKLVDIEAVKKNGSNYILSITFEEDYQGNKVFFYQINKMPIYPFMWPLYIMQGNEKKYCGTFIGDMNEKNMNHPRYKDAN